MLIHQDDQDTVSTEADPQFRRDVIAGLGARPRYIPPRWLYDQIGSALFDAITELPEYYVSRTETALLAKIAGEISDLAGPGRAVVEFGPGSAVKTPILLSALGAPAYVPVDISKSFLRDTVARLSTAFPALGIYPLEGDFTRPLDLPAAVASLPPLGFFPGSTIGNFLAPDAVDLLRGMATTLGRGSMLLIGVDRVKDAKILVPAYDDAQGITAAFNLNLLQRINRELAGTIPIDAFRHVACWKASENRIEMHLEARRNVSFEIDRRPFSLSRGETIHTENSVKYHPADANALLRAGGWTPIAGWTDPDELFQIILSKR